MKKNLIIIFLIAFAKMNSQTPNWIWAKSEHSGHSGVGEGWCVATDGLENIYMAGYYVDTVTFGSFTLSNGINYGNSNPVFLVKYNSIGDVLWAKSSSNADGRVYSIATDNHSNCIVLGQYFTDSISFGAYSLANAGYWDTYIVKYDSSGNVLWLRGVSGTAEDWGTSVTTDALGNIYIAGNSYSASMTFGSYTLVNPYGFLVKYDPAGNVLWARTGVTPGCVAGYTTTDVFGNVYLTGHFGTPVIHFDSDSLINSGGDNFFIAKYDSLGNVLWARSATGTGNEYARGIASDNVGNTYTTGSTSSTSITFGSQNVTYPIPFQNFFLVKYNSSGTALWARGTIGTNSAVSYCIDADADGNSYISGGDYNASLPLTFDTITLSPITGAVDPMFIVKYDSCGHIVFAMGLPSGGDDNNAIVVGPSGGGALGQSGNLYVAGDFYQVSPFILGNDSLTLTGIEDAFIGKLSNPQTQTSCSATNSVVDLVNNWDISIYPNPFSSSTTINFSSYEWHSINITDVLGKEIKTINFTGKQCIIEKGEMSSGIYFVQIADKNKNVVNRKIVVQ